MGKSLLTEKEFEEFLNNLENYREKNTLSWKEVAENMGCGHTTVINWKQKMSKPSMNKVRKLKELLGIDGVAHSAKAWAEQAQKAEIKPKTEKVSLESETEIIKALVDGEKVYCEDAQRIFKMINGVICAYNINSETPLFINVAIDPHSSYYAIRENKLKLKAGKKYKTKNNLVIFIFREHEGEFLGVCDDETVILRFSEDGICKTREDFTLVEEM